jgi:hypothetical protein
MRNLEGVGQYEPPRGGGCKISRIYSVFSAFSPARADFGALRRVMQACGGNIQNPRMALLKRYFVSRRKKSPPNWKAFLVSILVYKGVKRDRF